MSLAKPLQIAIDGPAASGKTTVARLLAHRLQLLYFDTGAMYRALACLALQTQTNIDNGAALARLVVRHPLVVELDDALPLGFAIATQDGRAFSEAMLQSSEVTAVVSTVAAHREVRAEMVTAQRRVASESPVVMAGRDIGTIVLPDAAVKVYLTASVRARVRRRRAQLRAAGMDVGERQLAQEIEERDRLDRTRAISPLRPAPDAHEIDSSDLSAEEVVDDICALVRRTANAS